MSERHEENREEKIIVDEDWKARVQAEKEAAGTQAKSPGESPAGAAESDPPLPPPSLMSHCDLLGTQAIVALGLMPNPATGKAEPRLNLARHLIDTLDLLQAKTAGNRTDSESRMLESLLHQLRLAYVTVSTGAEG